MLLGHAVGAVRHDEVFGALENQETFERSDLAHLGFTLNELRCEAYFYESLLEDVTGDPKTAHARHIESLRHAVETQVNWYYDIP
jgi:hypothetical protein